MHIKYDSEAWLGLASNPGQGRSGFEARGYRLGVRLLYRCTVHANFYPRMECIILHVDCE